MKKYSKEWKQKQGAWVQNHNGEFKIHYIENDTEYSTGSYYTKSAAEFDLAKFK